MARGAPNSWLVLAGGSALAAGVSLLAKPGTDLWEALAGGGFWLDAGSVGAVLWRGLYAAGGQWGVGAFRALAVLIIAAAVLWDSPKGDETGGSSNGRIWASTAFLAAWAALLPWGPGLLFYVCFVAAAVLSPARLWAAFLLCLLWPSLDGLFTLGVPAVVLWTWPRSRKSAWLLLAPLLNPAGLMALAKGDALLPVAASWANIPACAAACPNSASFWLVLVAGAGLILANWEEGAFLGASVMIEAAGLALKPLAPWPALMSAAGGRGARQIPGWLAVLTVPFTIWCLSAPHPAGPANEAFALVRQAPLGSRTLVTGAAWRSAAALALKGESGWTIRPEMNWKALFAFRAQNPEGPTAPFEGNSEPGGDFVLIRADYPAVRSERPLQAGWSLLSAGRRYVLFAKLPKGYDGPLSREVLSIYSPFRPLAADPGLKPMALEEALRLIQREPHFFEALRDAGRLETDLGKLEDAGRHLRLALEERPRDAEIHNDLAVVLQMKGDLEEARKQYLESLTLDPAETLPRTNLAGLEMAAGRPAQAIALLKDVVLHKPRDYPARRMLAQALAANGETGQAKALIQEIPADSRTPADEAFMNQMSAASGGAQGNR